MRQINKIIIHCSATPENRVVSVETIRKWHLERGFNDIGYHYVIHLDGSMSYGRSIDKNGAHTRGHNRDSIGICYIGGMDVNMDQPKDTRTPDQIESMDLLIKTLKKFHPKSIVFGHNNFSSKACPSFDALNEYCNE